MSEIGFETLDGDGYEIELNSILNSQFSILKSFSDHIKQLLKINACRAQAPLVFIFVITGVFVVMATISISYSGFKV